MYTPNPKRTCYDVSSSIQNPNSLPIDSIFSSFLSLPDSSCIGSSFDRVLGQILSSASGDQDRIIIDHALNLTSILHESAKRFARNRATLNNYESWSLPHELTIKVFSMLDTMSLMRAATCCTMFSKSAMDPLCYSHIDFTTATKRINDNVVCIMIHRAGKELRSLKLGRITRQVIPSLTSSCLAGDILRSLYFNCLDCTCTKSLCDVLSACPNLTDLKIVNFDKRQFLEKVLKSLTGNHRLIEHLHLENRMDTAATGLSSSTLKAFVASCPKLTSLSLIGFKLKEETALNLTLGFPKLNYMNLSKTPGITGGFLSDLVNSGRGNSPLKTLILRDCPSLNNVEITQFLKSLITTDDYFRFIRHIDVSSDHGFRDHRGIRIRMPIPKNLLKMLKEERSDVKFVAESKISGHHHSIHSFPLAKLKVEKTRARICGRMGNYTKSHFSESSDDDNEYLASFADDRDSIADAMSTTPGSVNKF